MGHRHHEPAQAPPGRRATLTDAAIPRLLRAAARYLGGGRRRTRASAAGGPAGADGRGETFRALLEINKKISAAAPTDTLLTLIAEEAARLLGVDNAGFRLVDGDDLVVAGLAGTAAQTMLRPRLKRHESLSGRVASEGRPIIIDLKRAGDVLLPEHIAADRRLGYLSCMAVPLRVGDRTIGVLSFRARRMFTPADQEVAEAFAGQAALALEQSRLYLDARRQAERMAALAAVERLIAETLDTEVVAQRIVDSIGDLLDARAAALYRLDPETGRLVAMGVTTAAGVSFEWTPIIAPDEGATGRAVRERVPVASEDVFKDERLVYTREVRTTLVDSTVRAFLSVPLIVRDRVFGALVIGERTGRRFTDEEIRLAAAFADQAAIALENARLFALESARHAQTEALAEVEREMAAELNRDRLFTLIVQRAARLFAGHAVIHLVAGERLAAAAGTGPDDTHSEPALGVGLIGQAALHGRGFLVNDYAASPHADRRFVARGQRRAMGVPLVLSERVVGVVSVFRSGEAAPPFTEDDRAVLESFANQAAIALENARLHEESERRRRTAEHLADLGRSMSQSLDPEEVGQRIVENVRALFGVLRCALYGARPGSDDLVVLGFSNDESIGRGFGRDLAFQHGVGVVGMAVDQRRLAMTTDALNDPAVPLTPELRATFEASPLRALAAVPLIVGDAVIGVLATGDRAGRRFDEEEIRILGAFADQAAIALENARLYRRARDYSDRLLALEEVNRVVSSSLQMDEVLKNLAAAAAQFFDAPYVTVWVVDAATGRLRRSLAHGDPQLGSGLRMELEIGQGLVGWVVEHREPILWTDVERDPRAVDAARMVAHGMRYFTAYPIAIGDRVLGAFSVSRMTPPALSPETISLLGSLAAQASLALDHARLFTETERRLVETRALLEVAEILSSTLDSKRLLRRVAMKIAQMCRVDRCSFSLWDGERSVPIMSQFADGRRDTALWEAWTRSGPYPLSDVPVTARALETRRPVVIDDAAASDLVPRHWGESWGVKSCMLVPLVRQETVIGVMTLDHTEQVAPFEPWQTDLAMAIAAHLALSLENTRLYSEAQERLHETTTLLAMGRVLSEPGPPDDVMRRVAREVGRAFGADMVGAYVLDTHKGSLVAIAGYHVPPHLVDFFRTRPIVLDRFPAVAAVWRSGRSTWTSDATRDPQFDGEWTRPLPPHSVLLVPTQVRGESVAVLFLVWWRPGRVFAPSEIQLVEGVAAQVGLALENADLARQTQAKLRETEALLSVSRALSTTLDLTALFRHFLRRVTSTLGADSAAVWLLDEEGEWMAPHTGYHVPVERIESLQRLRLSIVKHELYAEAARTRRPVFAADIANDSRLPASLWELAPHRSHLFVPIVAQGRFIGGFAAVWWERERQLSAGEVDLMEAIANQAAIAIANARLFEENRRQVEELSVLHELSRAVTGELNRNVVIDAVARQAARVLDARQLIVVLVDEARDDLEVALRVADGVPQEAHERYPRRGVGLQSVVLETGRALRTDDYVAACARHGVEPVSRSAALRYWLGVPIRAGGQTLGVIALRSAEQPFTVANEHVLGNIGQLAALALHSARLFDERTRAYGQLAAAQDQLVRTEKLRALGEMASGVAHDFNNVLAAILGRAQLLQRYVRDAKLGGWLQVIERSALDGAQTVRRLQEFARIRRDQPFGPVDLNEVVRDALEMTQSRWREDALRQGVVIEARVSTAPLAGVAGDAAELREAMTNLVLNAVDAMPRGGVLSVRTAVVEDTVELTVSDTGVGIPPALREKIFDPFFTTKGPQGTGLGLSMTYGILSRHGARITVESEEGQGSTFRIVFPRSDGLEAPPPAPSPEAPGTPGLRCLVVDDEKAVASVIGDVLEATGHRVVVLTDGADAIARLSREPFDVVFTDLAMPRVSGWDVARAAKSIAPAMPVFLVTGFGVELSAAERQTHGIEAVFSKPLRVEDITQAIARVYRHAGARHASEGDG